MLHTRVLVFWCVLVLSVLEANGEVLEPNANKTYNITTVGQTLTLTNPKNSYFTILIHSTPPQIILNASLAFGDPNNTQSLKSSVNGIIDLTSNYGLFSAPSLEGTWYLKLQAQGMVVADIFLFIYASTLETFTVYKNTIFGTNTYLFFSYPTPLTPGLISIKVEPNVTKTYANKYFAMWIDYSECGVINHGKLHSRVLASFVKNTVDYKPNSTHCITLIDSGPNDGFPLHQFTLDIEPYIIEPPDTDNSSLASPGIEKPEVVFTFGVIFYVGLLVGVVVTLGMLIIVSIARDICKKKRATYQMVPLINFTENTETKLNNFVVKYGLWPYPSPILLWTTRLLFLFAVVGYTFTLIPEVLYSNNHPTTTVTMQQFEKLDFPTITICPPQDFFRFQNITCHSTMQPDLACPTNYTFTTFKFPLTDGDLQNIQCFQYNTAENPHPPAKEGTIDTISFTFDLVPEQHKNGVRWDFLGYGAFVYFSARNETPTNTTSTDFTLISGGFLSDLRITLSKKLSLEGKQTFSHTIQSGSMPNVKVGKTTLDYARFVVVFGFKSFDVSTTQEIITSSWASLILQLFNSGVSAWSAGTTVALLVAFKLNFPSLRAGSGGNSNNTPINQEDEDIEEDVDS